MWWNYGDVTLHGKIMVLQPFTFALHTSTCQFSKLHQAAEMLSCVCAHKHVTSRRS
jgi:hypothetical protein